MRERRRERLSRITDHESRGTNCDDDFEGECEDDAKGEAMASWAQMVDAVWAILDGYVPLTSWLTTYGGQKLKFTADDRLRMDLTKADLPVF